MVVVVNLLGLVERHSDEMRGATTSMIKFQILPPNMDACFLKSKEYLW
jgi:hypothetical protein